MENTFDATDNVETQYQTAEIDETTQNQTEPNTTQKELHLLEYTLKSAIKTRKVSEQPILN